MCEHWKRDSTLNSHVVLEVFSDKADSVNEQCRFKHPSSTQTTWKPTTVQACLLRECKFYPRIVNSYKVTLNGEGRGIACLKGSSDTDLDVYCEDQQWEIFYQSLLHNTAHRVISYNKYGKGNTI